jgi:hypothetical protein
MPKRSTNAEQIKELLLRLQPDNPPELVSITYQFVLNILNLFNIYEGINHNIE